MKELRVLGLSMLAVGATAAIAMAAPGAQTGPSSSDAPYVAPSEPGVVTKAILTVGDSVNDKPSGGPYRMVGIPDGLGAYDNGDGTFTLLANHEIPAGLGIVRAHGANGAFVSKWTIQKDSLEVLNGEDLIRQVATWNTGTSSYNAPASGIAMARLCSADLPEKSAFWNGSLGYDGRLFMDGEEIGAEGRGFAHSLEGTSWELPRLGKFSWENSVASPDSGNRTVVIGLDDSSPFGEVYVYVGTKTGAGSPVDKAGLTNGSLYGIRVSSTLTEDAANGIPSGPFTLYSFGNVSNMTGAQLQTASNGNVTRFLRPEDGAWDTQDPNVFYFVTTATFATESRLWRLTFNDVTNPAAGGTIDMLVEGNEEGHRMFDNIAVDSRGRVLINEDPGNQAYLARIWQYDPESDSLTDIAHFDPDRFAPGGSEFLTQDEESSGIIDASSILGEGTFLSDVQAHYGIPGELVEGGQLFALHVPPGKFK
jgi:hypothetical protein